jgi:hypothetical protein
VPGTITINLSAEETEPAFVEYIDRLYDQALQNPTRLKTALLRQNRAFLEHRRQPVMQQCGTWHPCVDDSTNQM